MNKIYSEKRFMDFRELINSSAARFGNRTAFEIKTQFGTKLKISYREFRDRYYALCNHFVKCGLSGKRIATIGKNCFEWVLSYVCAATVGVAVPLDKELSAKDIHNFLNAADCAAVCFDQELEDKIDADTGAYLQRYSFADLISLSDSEASADNKTVDALCIRPDKMQVLIFTSGTTGNAKGVCLSQFAICSDIYSTVRAVRIKSSDVTLSVLPLHHTYECTLNCLLFLSRGGKITYCDGLTKIQKNLIEYSPSVLVVVPALLKMLNRRIRLSLSKESPEKYRPLFEQKSLSDALRAIPFPMRQLIAQK